MRIPGPFPLLTGLPITVLPGHGTLLRLSRACQIQAVRAALARCGRVAVAPTQTADEGTAELRGLLARVCAFRELAPDSGVIVLMGLRRIVLIEVTAVPGKSRLAIVQPLNDVPPAADGSDPVELRRAMISAVRSLIPETRHSEFEKDADNEELSLGTLGDLVADSLPMSPLERQDFLKDPDVESRSRRILGLCRNHQRQCDPSVTRPDLFTSSN